MTDQPTAAPLAHSSVMGGSNANKRINCPGSYELEAQMPEQPESPYATQGSVFHTAMEMLLTADPRNAKELKQVTDDLIGNDLGYGDEWAITVEQINTKILPAWDAWKTLVAEYDIDDYFIEVRVSLDTVGGRAPLPRGHRMRRVDQLVDPDAGPGHPADDGHAKPLLET